MSNGNEDTINIQCFQQEEPEWCWAACFQMLIRYYFGQTIAQRDIVKMVHCPQPNLKLGLNIGDVQNKMRSVLNLSSNPILFPQWPPPNIYDLWASIQDQVRREFPVLLNFTYGTVENSHYVIIYGTEKHNDDLVVMYFDPFPKPNVPPSESFYYGFFILNELYYPRLLACWTDINIIQLAPVGGLGGFESNIIF